MNAREDPRLANPELAELAARVARARRFVNIEYIPLEQSATILIPDEAASSEPRRRTMKEILEERGER